MVGALLIAFPQPKELINSATLHFAHAAAYSIVNIYMVKMAVVFMITTSTMAIYTWFVPRWLALLGNGLSLLLLLGSYYVRWSFLGFPLWVFTISISLLGSRRTTR
jgi:hypothetical protein